MRISIIVPVFNAETTIEKTVESLLSQNYNQLELILVDDGSQDASWEVCGRLQSAHNCIKILRAEGKGVSAARNTGLQHASGQIIGFCDADDFYEPNVLTNVLQRMEQDKIDILVGGFQTVTYRQTGTSVFRNTIPSMVRLNAEQMMERVLNDSRVMGSVWNKFYKAEILQDIFFDETLAYCEDTFFNVSVLKAQPHLRCMIVPNVFYNYMSNDTSATHDYNRMFLANHVSKYNQSMYRIEDTFQLTKKELGYVRRARYKISVVDVNNTQIDALKRRLLYEEVKNNWLCFAVNFYKFAWKHNIKMLLWGLKAILHGAPGES